MPFCSHDKPQPSGCLLDPTAGHEEQGTRPVLIVTPAAFNRVTRLPVVVPVTS
ncbi:TPA: type II toxin-antitoxin system PemK/MazF family toxin, partial [Escherichia coli]|nr:type II toxin-antitoxin system PemK/MazF family toxin [Escherichia coli]